MINPITEYKIAQKEAGEERDHVIAEVLAVIVLQFLNPLIAYLLYGFCLEPYYDLPSIGYWQWFAIIFISRMILGRIVHDRK